MLIEFGDAFDYTGADFAGWCKEAGFKETEIVPLAGPTSAGIAYKELRGAGRCSGKRGVRAGRTTEVSRIDIRVKPWDHGLADRAEGLGPPRCRLSQCRDSAHCEAHRRAHRCSGRRALPVGGYVGRRPRADELPPRAAAAHEGNQSELESALAVRGRPVRARSGSTRGVRVLNAATTLRLRGIPDDGAERDVAHRSSREGSRPRNWEVASTRGASFGGGLPRSRMEPTEVNANRFAQLAGGLMSLEDVG